MSTRKSSFRNLPILFSATSLLLGGGALSLGGQSSPVAPAHEEISLSEIVERMSRSETAQSLELKHYTSTRTYHLVNRRFKATAEMTILLTYRFPGQKDFQVLSESGSGPLRDRVLRRLVESEVESSRGELRQLNQLTPSNYQFRLLRRDINEGRPVFVLGAIPKTKSKYLIRGEVWVDAEDFGVSKVVARPAKSPSFLIRSPRLVYRYAKFGTFWLPVAIDSEADALLFGHTDVKIRHLDYRINSEDTSGSAAAVVR